MTPTNELTPVRGPAVPDVYRAICQVSKAISRDGIAKGRRNEQQGYGFRGIDDVYNALSAILAGAELCILPRMVSRTQEERPTAKGGVLFYVTVQADFDFVSARDGSIHTVTMYGEAMDSADKATNKAMSAAYKYCCMQVFCIPTEGMEDADATTPRPEPNVNTTGSYPGHSNSGMAPRPTGPAPLAGVPKQAPGPPADPLAATVAGFSTKAAIAAAFAEIKKEWMKYESEEAFNQTLEQFGIVGDFKSISQSKKCFSALWRMVEKMMMEAQNATATATDNK